VAGLWRGSCGEGGGGRWKELMKEGFWNKREGGVGGSGSWIDLLREILRYEEGEGRAVL